MVVRKKKYQSGEASNFVTRKQALHKLQLNLKVRKYVILRMSDNVCKKDSHIWYDNCEFSRIFEDYVFWKEYIPENHATENGHKKETCIL